MALVAFLGAAHTLAADALSTELTATKRVLTKDKDGHEKESFVTFTKALPGDDVVYTITCRNSGAVAAADIVMTLPIPAEMRILPESATGNAEVTYSVDAGKTYDLFSNLVITAPDGASRPARAEDVTTVRWKLRSAIEPHQQVQVSCRATLK